MRSSPSSARATAAASSAAAADVAAAAAARSAAGVFALPVMMSSTCAARAFSGETSSDIVCN